MVEALSLAHPDLRLFAYDSAGLAETPLATLDHLAKAMAAHAKDKSRLWVDVAGRLPEDWVTAIAGLLDINPFDITDATEPGHRAGVEALDNATRVIASMAEGADAYEPDPLVIFFTNRLTVTLQHSVGDCMELVRTRLRNPKSRVRSSGPDYLVHAILESVIDAYFAPLDRLAGQLDLLEDEIAANPNPTHMRDLHRSKRELLSLKRAIWPMREVLLALSTDDVAHVKPATRRLFRATQSYAIQLIEIVENDREWAANILDLYQSALSNRMNEVMKVLAVISTIFIPLSFLAGVWGMNFTHMPELDEVWGYPAALTFMATVAFGLIAWFKLRKWL
jgi:magnesium transporter